MKTVIDLDWKQKCTGCYACFNACPVNAISMEECNETFLYPTIDTKKCINCNKCRTVCPVLNNRNSNRTSKYVYAVKANNDIRKESSSGGIFTLVAEYIIAKGGYVCGASFDDNLKLKHIIVNHKNDLSPLRRSKYLQSEINFTFRAIRDLLEDNKLVLFIGTPCQVAGLKKFLGKEYSSLFLIDLFCGGVPSQKMFDMYIKENYNGKKIKVCKFRDKKYGWSCRHLSFDVENNQTIHASKMLGDPYLVAFLSKLNLRRSCAKCMFADLPRQGDISIGDFWTINDFDRTISDGLGVSALLINNEKGDYILKHILNKRAFVKKYLYDSNTLRNRTVSSAEINKNRGIFFTEMAKTNSFTESVNHASNYFLNKTKKYNLCVVCNFLTWDFGSSICNYAFFTAVHDINHSILLVERPLNSYGKLPANPKIFYKTWPYPAAYTCPRFVNKEEMEILNTICEKFILGPGLLLDNTIYKSMGQIADFNWVDKSKFKLAYSSSFGTLPIKQHIDNFNVFLSDEIKTVEYIKKKNILSDWVINPIFLCNKKHYYNLIQHASNNYFNSICICLSIFDTSYQFFLSKLQKKYPNKKIVVIDNSFSPIDSYIKTFSNKIIYWGNSRVEERLRCIIESSLIITDSYYVMSLSILFNKTFFIVNNGNTHYERIKSLLYRLGLITRLLTDLNSLVSVDIDLLKSIDYAKANCIIEKEILKSNKILKKYLSDSC